MIADFLEPFWEALFEKTGVFGIFLATLAPIIFILVLLIIVAAVIGIFKYGKRKRLIKMYEKALDLEVDCRYDEAWALFKKYVKKAPPSEDVYYHIGMFCLSAKEDGWKYSKGDARPSYWFEKSAAMGHKAAQFQLLKIRFRENFPADIVMSAKIIREIKELAEKGLPEAKKFLQKTKEELEKKVSAGIMDKNEVNSIFGDSFSQMYLAKTYAEQNKMKESYNLITLSAENGNPDAQYMVADLYLRGTQDKIIEKNPKKAVEWYKKAADRENIDAMIALGELYYVGKGCEKDLLQSAKYFAKAADEGNASAAHNAAICYQNYAFECAERKGLTKPMEKKLDHDYMVNMIKGLKYEKRAEELGYKEK